MIFYRWMEVSDPPIGKEKKGQYPEKFWIDINVRFLGALLAQKIFAP